MLKERMVETMLNQFLLTELKKPFIEFEACKLQLIDDKGNRTKVPVTEEEKTAMSPFTKNLIRIKKYLGVKVDLVETLALSESQNAQDFNLDTFKKVLGYEQKINGVFEQFHQVVDEALKDGVSYECIEALIR